MSDIKPIELAHSFYSVLVSVSVFKALSTVFHSINSANNSQLSNSVFLVLFVPFWVLSTVYLVTQVSLGPDITLCG